MNIQGAINMPNKNILLSVLIITMLALSAGVAWADEVTSEINYQGRLTDSSGSPLTGTYTMTFRLYEAATGRTVALATDTHTVDITDGLFNTGIDFGTSDFDGRELWLGVKVGADSEMTPRQELRPVPYALSLRPGAKIIGSEYIALHAESTHTSGRGIYGYATATSGATYGVYGASISPGGYGGYFYNNESGIGVGGKGGKYGGYFTTNHGGTLKTPNAGVKVITDYTCSQGVHAHTHGDYSSGVWAFTSGDYSEGVRASTIGDGSEGVHVETTGIGSHGVHAHTHGDYSSGVWASTSGDHSEGVYVETTGDESDGVRAKTTGDGSYGLHARADGTYGTGIWAQGGPSGYAGIFSGNVKITDRSSGATIIELGKGLDYAEGFNVSELTKIESGSVLIIDPDNPGKLTMSNTPYDTKVAGIVAGANGMGSGVRLGTSQYDYDVALAGRVYCNVDAAEAGVEPGDLLTTSATPGYAMKTTDYERAQGAILGKAMQRLEKGEKGQILVLVTLQ